MPRSLPSEQQDSCACCANCPGSETAPPACRAASPRSHFTPPAHARPASRVAAGRASLLGVLPHGSAGPIRREFGLEKWREVNKNGQESPPTPSARPAARSRCGRRRAERIRPAEPVERVACLLNPVYVLVPELILRTSWRQQERALAVRAITAQRRQPSTRLSRASLASPSSGTNARRIWEQQ